MQNIKNQINFIQNIKKSKKVNILVELLNNTMKNINNSLKIELYTSANLKSLNKRHAKPKNEYNTCRALKMTYST